MRICPFCKIVAEARLAAAVTEPRTEKSFILKVSSSSGELKQGGNRENCLLAMGYCPLYISQLIVSFVRGEKRYTNCLTHPTLAMKGYGTTRDNAC